MFQQAAHIVDRVGLTTVQRLTGRSANRIRRWRLPRDRGGSDGLIPTDCLYAIAQAAERGEVNLTPADFFPDLRDWSGLKARVEAAE